MPDQRPSFWSSLPGVLTAIAAVLGAGATLITALYSSGLVPKSQNIQAAAAPATATIHEAGLAQSSEQLPQSREPAPQPREALPESIETLRRYVDAMVTAAETNNTSYVRTLERDLIIPNYTRWFVDTFGAEAGQRLAVDYAILIKQAETPEGLLSLAKVVQRDFTPIEVSRIDDPSDSNATGLQRKALLARRKPIALYTVELRGFSFWSFVYVDGAFRIAGKMQALSD